jgi:hypothetical protein
MTNRPTQASIEGLLQDMGEVCSGTSYEMTNGELHITEANAADWYALHADLSAMFDRLQNLIDDSKHPEPTPVEYLEYSGDEYKPAMSI